MSLSLGIVGLPNVGKSTLFNTLTAQQIPAENYPFCTIEPNTGIVEVLDERLDEIASIVHPKKKVYATVKFVDIAGIVKGASVGEGLGNKFLAHIREVDAILQVVRAFESKDVTHVENRIDPKGDIEIIESELILKDIETIENRIADVSKKAKVDKLMQEKLALFAALKKHLELGRLAIDYQNEDEEFLLELKQLSLLTNKPFVYLINSNVIDQGLQQKIVKELGLEDKTYVLMDVLLESEMAMLEKEEREEYLQELGLEDIGLHKLTRVCYNALSLISYFTAGEDEARAWTITEGMTAPEAGSVIHNDFKDKFVGAEVIAYKDFITDGGWIKAKENGHFRLEGKDYIVRDGDVVIFKHGA